MKIFRTSILVLALAVTALAFDASAQGRPDPEVLLKAQREAMSRLSFLDGVWRGPAWADHGGGKIEMTQTERLGPFLDGAVKVLEGRGYLADGSVGFNAFAVISYDVNKKGYSMRSYAMGHAGDFVLTPTEDGFTWEIPAGPMTIRYTAVIKDGTWNEYGERILPGQDPVRFMEMNLKRIGDTDWPAAGAITPE